MSQQSKDVPGPDFAQGVRAGDIAEGGSLAGRVGDEPVLLSRFGGALFAVGATCTHYGAALSEGLMVGDTVRCPWHHACFSLRTGEAIRAPAFAPLDRWRVEMAGALVFVREKQAEITAAPSVARPDAARIVIVGGGAAGFACSERLRRLGFAGALTILSRDEDAPYDRPNLSKDYLAGSAPDEWMPLRPAGFYRDEAIDLRLGTEVAGIDPARRTVATAAGEQFPFDRLLLATGSAPSALPLPGFDRANVHMLRTMADARALVPRAKAGARAVIIGSGFIGLEAASALSSRGVAVEIVSPDTLPMGRIFGKAVGGFLRGLHERGGISFHLGRSAASFDGRRLLLDDGTAIAADFLLLGIGVRPQTALASAAGLEVGDGILVDAHLETSAAGIYAAGDVASYPDLRSGRRLRIEHWVTAQRQGQVAAVNMLGGDETFRSVPFFWTEQHGVALRYVGHGDGGGEVRIDGAVDDGDFSASYFEAGRLSAMATVGRDRDSLEAEALLEGAPVS